MKLYNRVYDCKFVHKIEPRHVISTVWHFNKTSLDSDETVQPPFKLRNSK